MLRINESKLCFNCNVSILNEIAIIEADSTCLRLNVSKQTASQTWVICDAVNDLQRLSLACRVNVFIERNIFVPENA